MRRVIVGLIALAAVVVACSDDIETVEPAEQIVLLDVGDIEPVMDPFTGEVPTIGELAPAVTTETGAFPLLLTQCVVAMDLLPPSGVMDYTATREWTGDELGEIYSDVLDLSIDLDSFVVDEGGCFDIPVIGGDIPVEVLGALNVHGQPDLVAVEVLIEFPDIDGAAPAVQLFEPFWLVPGGG